MATTLNDHVGRVLGGRYRLIAPIGSGASAQVFLADDTTLRRRVAVKMLHPALAADETFLRRFRAEAQAAAAMNHPHIMAVFDWGEDEVPYLVSEYLGGGSLRAILDDGHRLSVSQALLVGLEAARGLEYAHRRGIVHRDIKPANLLFDDDARLRIADFGIARALAEAGWTEPHGAVVGTVRYASPEQAKGEPLTGRSDVYALALVINEVVTGTVPFSADTALGTLVARIDQEVPVGAELGPLRAALERAGQPDPADRPDAGEFTIALMAAAEELPRPEPLPLAGALVKGASDISVDATQLVPAVAGFQTPAAGSPVAAGEPTRVVERVERNPAPRTAVSPAAPAPYADDDDDQPRRRWPWVLLGLLLVMGAVAGGAFAYLANRTPTHEVPELAGRSHDELRAIAAENRWLLPETPNFERDDGVPADHVIRTDPPAGEKLVEGAELRYTISLGPTTVRLPPLENLPLAEAKEKLEAIGLVLAEPVAREHSETVPNDAVIRTETAATDIPKGESVAVVVSDGPAPRTIPEGLEGQAFATVQKSLADLGLKPVRVDEHHETVPSGAVIKVTPGAGQEVARDAEVSVAVSKGPAPRPIPRVSGKSVSEASELLTAAGFVITGVDGDSSKRVIDTDPPGGETHPYGTRVRIIARRT